MTLVAADNPNLLNFQHLALMTMIFKNCYIHFVIMMHMHIGKEVDGVMSDIILFFCFEFFESFYKQSRIDYDKCWFSLEINIFVTRVCVM